MIRALPLLLILLAFPATSAEIVLTLDANSRTTMSATNNHSVAVTLCFGRTDGGGFVVLHCSLGSTQPGATYEASVWVPPTPGTDAAVQARACHSLPGLPDEVCSLDSTDHYAISMGPP